MISLFELEERTKEVGLKSYLQRFGSRSEEKLLDDSRETVGLLILICRVLCICN